MSEWRPIKTAPVREWVLLYDPTTCAVGGINAKDTNIHVDQVGEWSIVRHTDVGPTHWMPLPTPPETTQ